MLNFFLLLLAILAVFLTGAASAMKNPVFFSRLSEGVQRLLNGVHFQEA